MSAEEDLTKALEKAIGGNDEKQEVTKWINTGFPNLNKAMSGLHSGGLGFGRLYELYGPSGAGKTALSTYLMINAQKMGGCAIFIDFERSFDVGMAENMGLNTKSPYWVYKTPPTWEKGNDIAIRAAKLIRDSGAISKDAPILIVLDSIASAIPESMFGKDFDQLNMNDTTALARITSTTLKAVASYCFELDVTGLYLNQVRTKPGVVYGSNVTTPGGVAMEFFASGRIELSRTKQMDKEDKELMTGQAIKAKIVKSKHTRPFSVAELQMGFNEDGSAFFDEAIVLIDYLCKLGILEQSGAYIVWDEKKCYKSALIKKAKEELSVLEKLRNLVPKDV